MKKKNNTRKLLIIAIVVLGILLAALLGLALYLSGGNADAPQSETSATEQSQNQTTTETEDQPQVTEESTVPVTTEPEDMTVSTKFGDHRYPGIWEDQVRTEVVEEAIGGYVVYYGEVNGKEAPLFTIYYGKGSANSQTIGTMKVDGLSLTVSVEMNDFEPDASWTQENIDIFCAMQEGLNNVIEHLKKDPAFTASLGSVPANPIETTKPADGSEGSGEEDEGSAEAETTAPPVVKDMVVSTSCGDLYYPGQWDGQVRAEVKEADFGCSVTFYGTVSDRELKLFTVFFAEGSEYSFPLGVITVDGLSMDVSMELYELEMDNAWNQEQMDTISAMQEGINYLIEKLQENPAFDPA